MAVVDMTSREIIKYFPLVNDERLEDILFPIGVPISTKAGKPHSGTNYVYYA